MVHDSIGAGGQPRLLSGNLSNFIGGTRESEIPAAVFFIFLFASPPGVSPKYFGAACKAPSVLDSILVLVSFNKKEAHSYF